MVCMRFQPNLNATIPDMFFYNLENNMRVYLYTALVIAAFYRTTNNNGI